MAWELGEAIGKGIRKFFSWRERKEVGDINALKKEALTGDDSNSLSAKFQRVFGRKPKK